MVARQVAAVARKIVVGFVLAVQCEPDLLEVVAASHPVSRFANFLHSGEKQSNQHADDGNYHEQLDEREPITLAEARDLKELLGVAPVAQGLDASRRGASADGYDAGGISPAGTNPIQEIKSSHPPACCRG